MGGTTTACRRLRACTSLVSPRVRSGRRRRSRCAELCSSSGSPWGGTIAPRRSSLETLQQQLEAIDQRSRAGLPLLPAGGAPAHDVSPLLASGGFPMFRRRYPIAMVVLVALAALPAAAHEYWLQPGRYAASRGDTVIVNAFVGEGFTGARLAYDPSRAERLTMHAAGAPRDLAQTWRPAVGAVMGCVVAPDDSGAVIAYLSRFTSIEIEPDRFDAYLREEGLNG